MTATDIGGVIEEGFDISKSNNKHANNKMTAGNIDTVKTDGFNEKNSNNKPTTTQHKQEYKEIYLYLFNKYKKEIEENNAKEKIHIIGRCKQCEEYSQLTPEEQDQLFYDLMKIDKRYK